AKIKDKSRMAYTEGLHFYNRSRISVDKTDAAARKQSFSTFAEAVRLVPQSVNANYLYGTYLNLDKRFTEAYPLLKKAVAQSPNVFEIRQEFWKSIENQSNKTEVQRNAELLADMDSFIRLPSDTPKTLQAVTFELGKRKMDAKKTEYENILLKRFPQSKEAERTSFFRIFEFQNKNKDKKDEYVKMLWDFINRPAHLDDSLLYTAYFSLYREAKEDKSVSDAQFLKIISGKVKYGKQFIYSAYLDSALALVKRGLFADAERIVKDSFAANEKYIDIQFSPEKPKSRQAALDEANANSHSTLVYIYFKMGKLNEVEDELTQAARLSDKDATTLYRLGQVYEAKTDFDKAEENYIKGFLASSWNDNPNTKAIKELYEKRNGNSEGFDAYFDKYRKQESVLRKARILAERNADPKDAATFSLKTIDDKTISFADLKGKIIVINVWGTWCSPCVAEMPQLQQLYKKYQNDKDVAIITMDTNDELETVKKFIADKKYEFPVLLGDSYTGNIMSNGNIVFPTTLFVDKQGKIAFTKTGSSDNLFDEFGWRIEALKADKK
ncbi:MAG: redoxin domain-containing protein, partial [Pyrinomonadaceae bacterium]